ncbi:hypothetical protein Acr_28g0006170 [Actinidia rufa]|uniref:Uncharacterized protein n=1 Tax=Actinidia rufa TaxID=165716 RepID=A0A7J0H9W4_9ERIC|nr:hypothetical protein Acr_28g0006170 [Actinidia rufa]
MSLESGDLAFAHREEGSSAGASAETKLIPEVRKEPPHDVKVPTSENATQGLEVCKELLQIDHSLAWKMYDDGAKMA